MRENIRIIRESVDGDRILSNVREVAAYHRIQCSTGYRRAAQHCLDVLQQAGIEARILSYPYDEKKWYWTSKSFLEWDCRSAFCDLVYPEQIRLADFASNNISVIQKSWPCDFSSEPLDIVLLDKGPEEEKYEGLDLRGKLIFVRDAFNPYVDWAVKKRGAAGIITDFMREVPGVRQRYDMTDIINYTSFWWRDSENEPHTFGFVLSPRAGDALAAVCRRVAEEHRADPQKPPYPQAKCRVDADLYPGHIEAVEGFLPGETDEEILIVAHLCHPRASANDNASGVASGIEVLRVLKRLTDSGALPPLRRGVRLCLIPEFSGTFAYLCENEWRLNKILAGFNLDMVGGRQEKGYGPLTITAQPHGAPSFVTDVAALVLDEVRREVISHNKGNYAALFNSLVGEFTAGSDHYILSDPTVGIPTPMLGQWPDINYHTSGDTVEHVDPYILHKSASIAAGYAYTLANLSESDVPVVLGRVTARFAADAAAVVEEGLEEGRDAADIGERIRHFARYHRGNCADIARFFPPDAVRGPIEAACADIDRQADAAVAALLRARGLEELPAAERKADPRYDYVPVHRVKGPVVHLDDYACGKPELQAKIKAYTQKHAGKVFSTHSFEALAMYYMDGRRTLNEIAAEAIQESRNGDAEMLHDYVQLLVDFGVVTIA